MFGSGMHYNYLIYDLHCNRCNDFSSTCTLPSFCVVNDETLVFLLFGFLYMYCSTASFENIGSLTINFKSGFKSGFLLCSLRIFKIFLDHLFLALPCNCNSNICIMSGVSNTLMANIFQASPRSSGISDIHQHSVRFTISLSEQLPSSFKSSLSWKWMPFFAIPIASLRPFIFSPTISLNMAIK